MFNKNLNEFVINFDDFDALVVDFGRKKQVSNRNFGTG